MGSDGNLTHFTPLCNTIRQRLDTLDKGNLTATTCKSLLIINFR